MVYNIVLLTDASEELAQAIDWFENQKVGLGVDFFRTFQNAMQFLKTNPKIYAKIYGEVRRLLLGKFRYAVYFLINEENMTVVIFAVLHQSQNPDIWQSRI